MAALREIHSFFRKDADFKNLTIGDLLPEISKKKIFLPSDLNRTVIQINHITDTYVAFDGQICSKFKIKSPQKDQVGVLYKKESFLHHDGDKNQLFVFQDYDSTGKILKNIKASLGDDKRDFFAPTAISGAYDTNLIKTYTDGH